MIHHKGTQQCNTERLILRKFKVSDAYDMFKNWACDSDVTLYLTWNPHPNIHLTKKIMDIWVDSYQQTTNYHWAIELKSIKQVIGSISLLTKQDNQDEAEIGYCIGKAFWNKGIMTEAVNAIFSYAFNEIGLKKITAKHHVMNYASGNVMKKCGMQYIERKIVTFGHTKMDCQLYEILYNKYFILRRNYDRQYTIYRK